MKTPTRHLVLGKYLVLKIVKKKVILPTLGLDEFDIGPAMIGCWSKKQKPNGSTPATVPCGERRRCKRERNRPEIERDTEREREREREKEKERERWKRKELLLNSLPRTTGPPPRQQQQSVLRRKLAVLFCCCCCCCCCFPFFFQLYFHVGRGPSIMGRDSSPSASIFVCCNDLMVHSR